MCCQRSAAAGRGAPGAPAGRQRRLAGGPPGGLRPLRRALRPAGDPGRAAVVYFRFAPHPPILPPLDGLATIEVSPQPASTPSAGISTRSSRRKGREVFYVFDNLSALVVEWATDELLANFFQVTCPFLFELDTVTYFALTRGRHSHRRRRPDPGHDPAPPGRLPGRRGHVSPPAQGLGPLLPADVPAAHHGRSRLDAGVRERGRRRSVGVGDQETAAGEGEIDRALGERLPASDAVP